MKIMNLVYLIAITSVMIVQTADPGKPRLAKTLKEGPTIIDLIEKGEISINNGKLDLSNKKLTSLQGLNEIPGIKDVTVLDLSENPLINLYGMPELTELEHLKLYDCSLTNLNYMPKLPKLDLLDLGKNKIKKLDEALPTLLPTLDILYLMQNKIEKSSDIPYFKNLSTLLLGNNPSATRAY
jgi:Leucine-rich repeat (LRR) protein